MVIDLALTSLSPSAAHRVWVISDLQQSVPARAQACLSAAVEDFTSLRLAVEQIWYLGDAVEGHHLPDLREMADMQVEKLSSLGVPLKYVLGNHDFDLMTRGQGNFAVFHDAVRGVPGWRTTDALESFYFLDSIGPFTVLFLSDHADRDGRWISTHGKVHRDKTLYPHSAADYAALREELAAIDRPVITCSHNAFTGGNRPSALHNQMLPLPANVKLHLYGHAHIGDNIWAGKDWGRKISAIEDHSIVQIDVASLECDRGSGIRSAILEIYADQSLGVYFRNHSTRRWEEFLLLDGKRNIEARGGEG